MLNYALSVAYLLAAALVFECADRVDLPIDRVYGLLTFNLEIILNLASPRM